MPMAPFHLEFRDLAFREMRGIDIMEESGITGEDAIPTGHYAFVESYCDEPGCDCRRAYLSVVPGDWGEVMATISYGWEEAGFYRHWNGRPWDEDDVREMTGPSLARLSPQSRYAPTLLELFRDVVLDQDYRDRLRRHYELFKDVVHRRHPKGAGNAAAPGLHALRNLRLVLKAADRAAMTVRPLAGAAPAYSPRLEDLGNAPTQASRISVGRNALCPCGSRKKYKKCCGG